MRILQFAQLKKEKGIRYCRLHLGRLEADGKFPKRVKLGPGCIGWVEHEVDAYIQAKCDERDILDR